MKTYRYNRDSSDNTYFLSNSAVSLQVNSPFSHPAIIDSRRRCLCLERENHWDITRCHCKIGITTWLRMNRRHWQRILQMKRIGFYSSVYGFLDESRTHFPKVPQRHQCEKTPGWHFCILPRCRGDSSVLVLYLYSIIKVQLVFEKLKSGH